MKKRRAGINIYFVLGFLLALTACESTSSKKKEYSTIRFHLEQKIAGGPQALTQARVYREHPLEISVLASSFLDERYVLHAEVVEDEIQVPIKDPDLGKSVQKETVKTGGFQLRIEFDRTGKMLLENVTGAYPGRRVAVFSQFGKEEDKARWLAAPYIEARISDGRVQFTPDATRAETERIAAGLNAMAKKLKTADRY